MLRIRVGRNPVTSAEASASECAPTKTPAPWLEVAHRLARHAMPAAQIERITRELADHWQDLHAEACARGLDSAEAAREANQRLGSPSRLAAGAIASFQRRSWLGRHPMLGLCLVPLVLPLPLMLVIMGPLAWLESTLHFTQWINHGQPVNPFLVAGIAQTVYYSAVALSFVWLSWTAWVRGLGGRWIIALAAWCALASLARHFDTDPVKHSLMVSFSFPWRLNARTALLLIIHSIPPLLLLVCRLPHPSTQNVREPDSV